jgi:hypothetical protein
MVLLQSNHQSNNIAFVLGNGRSRLNLNLERLQNTATVYACNAIYREYSPNFLVAVDTKMINEIIQSEYHKSHQVWTYPNKLTRLHTEIHKFSTHKGWSSGPTALWFAAQNNHKEIYIFGFDYKGINGKVNNVYADSINYKKSNEVSTFFGNWLTQTYNVISSYQSVNFYRVINSECFIPDRLLKLSNLKHITYTEFGLNFPECI